MNNRNKFILICIAVMLVAMVITYIDVTIGIIIYAIPMVCIVGLSLCDTIRIAKDYRKFKANCKEIDAVIEEIRKKREAGDTTNYKLVPTGEKILDGIDLMKIVEDKDEQPVAAN